MYLIFHLISIWHTLFYIVQFHIWTSCLFHPHLHLCNKHVPQASSTNMCIQLTNALSLLQNHHELTRIKLKLKSNCFRYLHFIYTVQCQSWDKLNWKIRILHIFKLGWVPLSNQNHGDWQPWELNILNLYVLHATLQICIIRNS